MGLIEAQTSFGHCVCVTCGCCGQIKVYTVDTSLWLLCSNHSIVYSGYITGHFGHCGQLMKNSEKEVDS